MQISRASKISFSWYLKGLVIIVTQLWLYIYNYVTLISNTNFWDVRKSRTRPFLRHRHLATGVSAWCQLVLSLSGVWHSSNRCEAGPWHCSYGHLLVATGYFFGIVQSKISRLVMLGYASTYNWLKVAHAHVYMYIYICIYIYMCMFMCPIYIYIYTYKYI